MRGYLHYTPIPIMDGPILFKLMIMMGKVIKTHTVPRYVMMCCDVETGTLLAQ